MLIIEEHASAWNLSPKPKTLGFYIENFVMTNVGYTFKELCSANETYQRTSIRHMLYHHETCVAMKYLEDQATLQLSNLHT